MLGVGVHAVFSKVWGGKRVFLFADSLVQLQRDSLQPEPSPSEISYWH